MQITNVKIRRTQDEGRMRAIVSVTFDDEIVIHDIKVIEGPDRLFLAMPSRRIQDGSFRDIVHPISASTREHLESEILRRYREFLEESADTAL